MEKKDLSVNTGMYGHVKDFSSAMKHGLVVENCGLDRLKMLWKELTEKDHRVWKFSSVLSTVVTGIPRDLG
jgi:uncharacterized protein YlaN (UPF0358 family)